MNVLHCMLEPCTNTCFYPCLILYHISLFLVFHYVSTGCIMCWGLYVRFDTCKCWEWNSVQYIYSVRKKPETCSRYRITLTCGHTCIMPNEQTYMKNSFTMETWYIYIYICKIRSLKYNVLHLYHCVCIFQEFKSLLLLFYFLFEWSTFQ